MCGEKRTRQAVWTQCGGSPPRVRGKVVLLLVGWLLSGITPACAGKSVWQRLRPEPARDHPRVCGEKLMQMQLPGLQPGSPPRVRGKGRYHRAQYSLPGITPACAGKRRALPRSQPALGDHPRVCGEKVTTASPEGGRRGSPPRVRGKDAFQRKQLHEVGITPACAGKSLCNLYISVVPKDHPRVCGEKTPMRSEGVRGVGSPPRVRGKACGNVCDRNRHGITPACAGKSLTIPKLTTRSWDHPRVCGEKSRVCPRSDPGTGSPPRVRGKARGCLRRPVSQRITPACAGKRLLYWKNTSWV